jgi:hypothetical protein
MRAGVAQGGLVSPVLFSLYVNDMPVPSRHVELALYADDTAIIATSRKSALLIRNLETNLIDLERWPREWRTVINVSKSNAMAFAKARLASFSSTTGSVPRWANPMGRCNQLLGSDSRFTPDLAASYPTGQKQSLPTIGCAWLSPKQEKRSPHQKRSSAV